MARLGPPRAAAQVAPLHVSVAQNHSPVCSDPREPLCPELSGSSRRGGGAAPPCPTPSSCHQGVLAPSSGDRVGGSWALLCLRVMRQLLGARCLQAALGKLIQKSKSDDNSIPLRLQRELNPRDAITSLELVQGICPREGEGPQKQYRMALPAAQPPKSEQKGAADNPYQLPIVEALTSEPLWTQSVTWWAGPLGAFWS